MLGGDFFASSPGHFLRIQPWTTDSFCAINQTVSANSASDTHSYMLDIERILHPWREDLYLRMDQGIQQNMCNAGEIRSQQPSP